MVDCELIYNYEGASIYKVKETDRWQLGYDDSSGVCHSVVAGPDGYWPDQLSACLAGMRQAAGQGIFHLQAGGAFISDVHNLDAIQPSYNAIWIYQYLDLVVTAGCALTLPWQEESENSGVAAKTDYNQRIDLYGCLCSFSAC